MSLTYVKVACLCKLNVFQAPFLTAKLPQATPMCHCSACRHITGTLSLHCAVLEGAPLAAASTAETHTPADLSTLAKYNASAKLTRYFCPTCSAYLFNEFVREEGATPTWMVSTGALERTEGVVKVGFHAFVADTLDGGLADHYHKLDGEDIPRYSVYKDGAALPIGWKADGLLESEERLEAYCHCKNISVHLAPAKKEDATDPSHWWYTKGDENDPNSRVRFTSGHCFCTSCRLASGSLMQSWVIIPRTNVIDNRTSLPVVFFDQSKDDAGNTKRLPGIKQYQSSPGVFREFCGTCGACAFYWTHNNKFGLVLEKPGEEPHVLFLGAGLLDETAGGARAEKWCFWFGKAINPEDALDKAGMEAVQESLNVLAKVDTKA